MSRVPEALVPERSIRPLILHGLLLGKSLVGPG